MVAYSFKPRFAKLIRDGQKCQTIRAHRPSRSGRHAYVGERLQLYTGLRTKAAVKIIPDPICTAVLPCWIIFDRRRIVRVSTGTLEVRDLDAFARRDGFADLADMSAFWLHHHGDANFDGVVIEWVPST